MRSQRRNRLRKLLVGETLERRLLLTFGAPDLVSEVDGGGLTGNSASYQTEQSLSADGRYFVFSSDANDLVAGDSNGYRDVFLRDLRLGTVELISRNTSGGTANYYSDEAVISADGQYVAFLSAANDLDATGANSTTSQQNVYRWERGTGTITLVSQNSAGNDGGDNHAYQPSISGDGSRIAFATYATDMQAGVPDDNGMLDVYVRDMSAGTTHLVSHQAAASLVAGSGSSSLPKISRDGSRVTYYSAASDLQNGVSDANATNDLVSYIVGAGTNQYVTLETTSDATANRASSRTEHSLSADGQFEVFTSDASDIVPGDTNATSDVFLRDLQTGAVTLVSRTVSGGVGNSTSLDAVISDDGLFVAFVSSATNLNIVSGPNTEGAQGIFLWSRASGQVRLVSVNHDGTQAADDNSNLPSISGDGRFVSFTTYATNLLPVSGTDANSDRDVYVFDANVGTTRLVSHAATSTTVASNSASSFSRVSRDGSRVVYLSIGSDLQTGVQDYNAADDIVSYVISTQQNQYVSLQTTDPGSANSGSERTNESLSADGRYEVFSSSATDLVEGDANNASDVFLRDLETGAITLVSRGGSTISANGPSNGAVISADGKFVVFASYATDLDLTGTNDSLGYTNIYRWERLGGQLELVSVNALGDNGTTGNNYEPSISGDGRWVAFSSDATDVVDLSTDDNANRDVFLRDMGDPSLPAIVPSTRLVSHTHTSLTTTSNSDSYQARISRDGTRVVYLSRSTDLQAGVNDANNTYDLVSYAVSGESNEYVSVATAADATANGDSSRTNHSLSANGQFEVFTSSASDLVPGDTNGTSDVFIRDLETGSVTLISRGAGGTGANSSSSDAVISANGDYVAFLSYANNLDTVATDPVLDGNVYWQNVYRWKRDGGDLELVSVNAVGDYSANWHSSEPSISGDGNSVAFSTLATDLLSGIVDENSTLDVYVREMDTQTTQLVSHIDGDVLTTGDLDSKTPLVSRDGSSVVYLSRTSDLQSTVSDANNTYDLISFDISSTTNQYVSVETATATLANSGSTRTENSLSADGQYEVFSSAASDLVPGDNNARDDIFIRNLQTGAVTLVSRGVGGVAANGASFNAVISADGEYVAFLSVANNLDTTTGPTLDSVYWQNVYRWKRDGGDLELVSVNAAGDYAANWYSYEPSISGDGNLVAFSTYATDLVAGVTDGNANLDVYLRDMANASTSLLSANSVSSSSTADGGSLTPLISRDGSTVVFESIASDLDGSVTDINSNWDLFAFDVGLSTLTTVSVDTSGFATADAGTVNGEVSLSDDGQVVAFSSFSTNLTPLDSNSTRDVFVRKAGVTSLVSVDSTGTVPGDGPSARPSISGNGDIVAYQSYATNLGTLSNGQLQIIVRDLVNSTTALVSVDSLGTSGGNDQSQNARISHDGAVVAFESFATDLDAATSGDTKYTVDVFVRNWSDVAPETKLVSRSLLIAGATGNRGASQPELSDDGSLLVFVSSASDLVSLLDVNGASEDIFSFDGTDVAAVTVKRSGAFTGNLGVSESSFDVSDNGQVIAFVSTSSGLVDDVDGFSGQSQVYVRDLSDPLVPFNERISVDAVSKSADGHATNPSLSGDGQLVAFESYASNLSSLADGNWQIYVRDRVASSTNLISVNSAGTAAGNNTSELARISRDGSTVAYQSWATNLDDTITVDDNGQRDVFIRNWQSATPLNTLISRKDSDTVAGNGVSFQPEISDLGERVVFTSTAVDLVAGISDINGSSGDIFAYASSLSLVTSKIDSPTTGNTGVATGFDLSDSGQFVVFSTGAVGMVADVSGAPTYEQVYLRDLGLQTTERISVDSDSTFADRTANDPSISGDGRYVAFQSDANNLSSISNGGLTSQIYVRDRSSSPGTATTTLVSEAAGITGNQYSANPRISHDGQWVVFVSAATNLDPSVVADTNNNVMLRQWASAGPITMLSRRAGGSSGNGHSSLAEISDLGERVVFTNTSTNLLAGYADANGSGGDIFAYASTGLALVSRKLDILQTGTQGVAAEFDINDTGAVVAFASSAQGLVLDVDGTPAQTQIYVRNTLSGITERISRDSDSPFADHEAQNPSLSGDGNFVSFASYAYNLGLIGNNGNWQVYVRDRSANTLNLISLDSLGNIPSQWGSYNSRLSHDGEWIAFESGSTDLDSSIVSDDNNDQDIFLRNWNAASPVTKLISRQAGSNNAANRGSYLPELNDDASRVVFDSPASNLVLGVSDANGANRDIFVYSTAGVSLVSAKGAGLFTGREGVATNFSVSDSGNFVAFSTTSWGLVEEGSEASNYEQVYVRNLDLGVTERISVDDDSSFADQPAISPSISGDGSVVAFISYANNLDIGASGYWQTFVRDRGAGPATTKLVSLVGSGPSATASLGTSSMPRISGDGNTVVFVSDAQDLAGDFSGAGGAFDNIFVRNWRASSPTNQLVSRVGLGDQSADSYSVMPVVNDDGSTIGFVSQASNLTAESDTNGNWDVFASRLIALAIDSVTHEEGDSGTTNYTFTVELLSPTDQTVTVDYTTVDGTATVANNDYSATAGTLSYAPGETLKTITVAVNGNMVLEPNELFTLLLSNGVNADILYGTGTGTITNDDTEVNVADALVIEGDSGIIQLAFDVTLVVPSLRTVTVDFVTADGTATAGSDYAATTGTLTFAPGETSKTVLVDVSGDIIREQHEAMQLNLSNATNSLIIDGTALGSIRNDDTDASINSVSLLEGNSGTTSTQLTVTLSHPSALEVSVDFATTDVTATLADSDYQSNSGTLVFAPGETTKTIALSVTGDTTPEDFESFVVDLSDAIHTGVTVGQGTVTVQNDDTDISVNDVVVAEPDSGSVPAMFTVTLSKPSALPVSVQVDTQNLLFATAPADYTAIVGSVLNFAPGETSKTVEVSVQGDELDEFNEQYQLALSSAINGSIGDANGLGTITDNDPEPTLSIDDITVVEGDGTIVQAVFTVTLSAPSGKPVSVNYALQSDTAQSPADFALIAGSTGLLNFAPGTTSQQITVEIVGDALDEFDESYFVNLTSPVNTSLADAQGLGVITDNDPTPTVSISSVSMVEGNAGSSLAVFTVSLSAASAKPISLDYATQANSATAASDFIAISGSLNFAAGETTKQISVEVLGDMLDEFDESFWVNLSNPVNVIIDVGQGTGTIADDDDPPIVGIDSTSIAEGDAGNVTVTFTVSLSNASTKPISVDFATVGDTATPGVDFGATSGTLNFAAGETTKEISVDIFGDVLDEIDEQYFIDLSNAINASIGVGQGLGTVTDDDPTPTLSISDASVVEGNSGTTNAIFTVTLSAASGQTVTVEYNTANGSATAPSDFATTSGTLTFLPGETSKQIVVPVVGDVTDELTETFVVNLSSPANATLVDAQGVGTILSDEAPKVVEVIVGDGSAQRSNVTQMLVKFNSLMTIDNSLGDAVSVERIAGSYGAAGSVATTWSTSVVDGKTQLLIQFVGAMTRGPQNALVDGNYKLTLNAQRFGLADSPAIKLDGDGNGAGGDAFNYGSDIDDLFFAMFGDINGDRSVSGVDYAAFRLSYDKIIGNAGYNSAFDYNGGGVINGIDFSAFRLRYEKNLGF